MLIPKNNQPKIKYPTQTHVVWRNTSTPTNMGNSRVRKNAEKCRYTFIVT